jgi:cystathionine beta-lyase/cystathionine gamma-synthase
MLSFELGGERTAQDFLHHLKLITPAMSLGGVESTAVMPVFASHRLMPAAQREALGITDRLIRLSVGIEAASDLIHDLQQALVRQRVDKAVVSNA